MPDITITGQTQSQTIIIPLNINYGIYATVNSIPASVTIKGHKWYILSSIPTLTTIIDLTWSMLPVGTYPYSINKTSDYSVIQSGNVVVEETQPGELPSFKTVGGSFEGTMDDIPNGLTYVKTENNLSNTLLGNIIVEGDSRLSDDRTPLAHSHPADSNKVDKVTGSSLVTDTEITKLAGVEAGANNYTHPDNHPASIITQDVSNRFVTDTEKSTWNNKGSSNLVLGDLAANAYYGDKGKTAYDHSQVAHAPSGATVGADWNTNVANKPTISGSNTGDETQTTISAIINAQIEKTTPVDADMTELQDSAASNVMKRLSWLNLKATLKTYFDTLYNSKRLVSNLTAPVVTSGTTEKVLLQLAIPANRAVVGSCFRATIMGNSSSTGTLIFKVREGAGGTITDAVAWTAITSAAQAANKRAGFDVIIVVRDSTHNYTDGVAYAGTLQLETVIAVPALSVIAISGVWYISLTVICSSGTFTGQVGIIEEVR